LYSNTTDYGEFIDQKRKAYKRCTELAVKISAPRLEKVADADLDIDENLLIF
jgi:hypothetical protein